MPILPAAQDQDQKKLIAPLLLRELFNRVSREPSVQEQIDCLLKNKQFLNQKDGNSKTPLMCILEKAIREKFDFGNEKNKEYLDKFCSVLKDIDFEKQDPEHNTLLDLFAQSGFFQSEFNHLNTEANQALNVLKEKHLNRQNLKSRERSQSTEVKKQSSEQFYPQCFDLADIARAIKLLYSKNCIVRSERDKHLYLFDSKADAEYIYRNINIKLTDLGIILLDPSNVTLHEATKKYGFLMIAHNSVCFYSNYSKDLFKKWMDRVLSLIQGKDSQLSSRTKKYLTEQLPISKNKNEYDNNFFVSESLIKLEEFEKAARDLALPSEIFWAIGGLLLTAALCAAMAPTAVPLTAGVVVAIKVAAEVTAGVSLLLGAYGLYKHKENKRLVNEALEVSSESIGAYL